MNTGIYKIENLIKGKVYIGSATNLRVRWGNHKSRLIKKNHHSTKLQNSWNKYGEENFKFEIIELCEKDKLIEREQNYIDFYDSFNNGYNCTPKAGNTLGFKFSEKTKEIWKKQRTGLKHSEETKLKISQWGKDRVFTEEHRKKLSKSQIGEKNHRYNPNKVIQCDLNDNFIKEWKDLVTLKNNGFNSGHISEVCRGIKKTYLGFKWKFK